jgi:hypothetical protein
MMGVTWARLLWVWGTGLLLVFLPIELYAPHYLVGVPPTTDARTVSVRALPVSGLRAILSPHGAVSSHSLRSYGV